ncbi:MAG: hypothetical protein Kow0077_17490 [Anaerolineae bacterium]
MYNRLSSARKQGQALVEFALILPIVLFLIFGIIDFGRLLIAYTTASNSLRSAARFATVVGQVATRRYLDCPGMDATARNVVFVNAQNVTINYFKANDLTTPISCATITDAMLDNGDLLQITSTNTVNLITPFLNSVWPSITLNFVAQRTIVKNIELVTSAADTEPDGLDDAWEITNFGNLDQSSTDDPDGDGLNNGLEEILGSDPNDVDTDGDSTNSCGVRLWDSDEVFTYQTDPTLADTDGDGVDDGEEICNGTDPTTFEPVAVDDSDLVNSYDWVTIVNVLANDRVQTPSEIYIVTFDATTTQGGQVRLVDPNGDGTGLNVGSDDYLEYKARPGFSGTDTFTYTISDSTGIQSTATVTITVNAGIATPVPTATPADIIHPAPFFEPVLDAQPQSQDWWRQNRGAVFMGYDDWQVEWWSYAGSNISDVDAAMATPAACTTTMTYDIPLTYNWGASAPTECGMPADNFAVRWTRSFGTAADFTATFKVMADDAVQILIDGSPVLDNWALGGGLYEDSFTHTFTGGVLHTIVIKYAELNGNAMMVFAPHDGSNDDRGVCGWAIDGSDGYNGAPAWTDYPNRNYYSYSRCSLELRGAVNLAGLANPEMSFWEHWALADANDVAWLQVREYGGGTPWYGRQLHTGDTQPVWTRYTVDLDKFDSVDMNTGLPAGSLNFTGKQIEFRFTLIGGDDDTTDSGWWVDEILIEEGTPDIFNIGWSDDMDSGNLWWQPGGTWQISSERTRSGAGAWSDSPLGNYLPSADYILELDGEVDVTAATDPLLVFYHGWDLGTGDSLYVEYSTDSGATWAPIGGGPLETATTNLALVREEISLAAISATPFQLRFRLNADGDGVQGNGWWIDDVALVERDSSLETVPFTDNVNNITNDYWYPDHTWAMSPEANHGTGGGSAWSDSPGTNYEHLTSSSLRSQKRFDISALTNPELSFWYRRDLGINDGLWVEVSTDLGATWTPVWSSEYRGSGTNPEAPDSTGGELSWTEFNRQLAWERVSIDMSAYTAQPFYLRFRMDAMSDPGVGDGVWIDDISINSYSETPHTLPFSDDMEGTNNWYMGGTWENSVEDAHAGGFAMNDSVGGNYATDTWSILQLKEPLDLTGVAPADMPVLTWWDRYALAQYDYARVQVSTWTGPGWNDWSAWQEIHQSYFETNTAWARHQVDLSAYAGQKIRLRFVLDALSDANVADGWYIDDVSVAAYNPTVYTLPFIEDADSLDGWLVGGSWTTSAAARGTGTGGLSAGAWNAYFYDLEGGTCAGGTDAEKAAEVLDGSPTPCGTAYASNPVALGDVQFLCGAGEAPDPVTGACSATPWKAEHLAIRFERTFTVSEAGQYDFTVTHNDGTRLYIYPVSDSRGTPSTDPGLWGDVPDAQPLTPQTFSVALAAGDYIIELWYYQNTGVSSIALDIDRPSQSFYGRTANNADDMAITLDGVIDVNGVTTLTLEWYQQYDLSDGQACVTPQVSLPYRELDRWVDVYSAPICGAASTGSWQLQTEDIRAALESIFGGPITFTGNDRYLGLRFSIYADTAGEELWIEDISVTGS